jgi:hypothetical protein
MEKVGLKKPFFLVKEIKVLSRRKLFIFLPFEMKLKLLFKFVKMKRNSRMRVISIDQPKLKTSIQNKIEEKVYKCGQK